MAPVNEPEGLLQVGQGLAVPCTVHAIKTEPHPQVLHRNWRKVLSVKGLLRNTSRMVRIVQWVAYHTLVERDLLQPFHMVKCA